MGARSFAILLLEGATLVVAATAGHASVARGARLAIADSVYGHVLRSRRSERVADASTRLGGTAQHLGLGEPRSALLVPLVGRGEGFGILVAFDPEPFDDDDEQALRTFAASAAIAVGTARTVREERLRDSVRAADAELRPAALDQFGLRPGIEALVDRHEAGGEFEIDFILELPDSDEPDRRLPADIETTVYRLVQEALTNVTKHAQARRVRVAVHQATDAVTIEVAYDGVGFSIDDEPSGFGLTGMRERVHLFGGTLTIDTGARGTRVLARVPTEVRSGGIAGLLQWGRAAS